MKEGFGKLKSTVSSTYFKAGVLFGSQVLLANQLFKENEEQTRALERMRALKSSPDLANSFTAQDGALLKQSFAGDAAVSLETTSTVVSKTSETAKESSKKGIGRELMPSIIAGSAVAYTTFPLEGLKKYLQQKALEKKALEQKALEQKVENKVLEQKNAKKEIKFRPYQGSMGFALNVVPTTTIQYFVNEALKTYFPDNGSVVQSIGKSVLCGVVGALTATFVENTIVRQQRTDTGLYPAVKSLFQEGALRPWKTYPHIAVRDGIFTFCMLWAAPEAVKYTTEKYGPMYEFPTRLAVSLFGAGLSHPFDTVATLCQASNKKEGLGLNVAKELFNQKGLKSFYKGFPARFGLFAVFSYALPTIRNYVDKTLFEQNSTVSNRK